MCGAGHSYDIARQGYVNLLSGGAHTGTADTAEMVSARERFLAAGHFAPLLGAVAAAARGALEGHGSDRGAGAGRGRTGGSPGAPTGGCVVDLGAGTGAYLAAVLDAAPGRTGLALDLSKYAARRAARSHPRAAAAVCDVWRGLPVRTAGAALVLDVFAPRNGAEIARALRPGGAAVVVTPTADHLRELVSALSLLTVDDDKPARVARQLEPHLAPAGITRVGFTMSLDAASVRTLVAMGPSARHVDVARVDDHLRDLPVPLAVTASVDVAVYQVAEPVWKR